jgi:glycosyltransferase involved in cell wall biosynthesis
MKTILHISADFPDPLVPAKTKAVPSLIAGAEGYRHVVYSLNRVSWRSDIAMFPFGEDRVALAYGAPPYGLRLVPHLTPVAETVAKDLAQRKIVPDLIHAHKFTVEGVVADALAAKTGAPFIASLWGDTDTKFFENKPRLRGYYQQIGGRAAFLLPPAPWTARYFADALGLDDTRFKLLPVMTAADSVLAPQASGAPKLVTVFAWDSWQRKGFDALAQAIALLAPDVPDLRLDVFGRGGPKALLEMTRVIEKSGAGDRIALKRVLDHGQVQETINSYAAFVMPSRRETYGMVYVEALLAGVPILWSQNQGVDGLFDNVTVGYSCDPRSITDIADGLRLLLAQETRLKGEIRRLQDQGAFDYLRRAGIGACYRGYLDAAMGSSPQAQPGIAETMPGDHAAAAETGAFQLTAREVETQAAASAA